jgi:hypothetical protein
MAAWPDKPQAILTAVLPDETNLRQSIRFATKLHDWRAATPCSTSYVPLAPTYPDDVTVGEALASAPVVGWGVTHRDKS